MSIGHLDHFLIVYSSMEHMTWKSPGPMCGWVGRILLPDSCTSVSSWPKVPLLFIWSVTVPLCHPLLPCPSRWHGSLPRHGLWWLTCELHCSPLPWRLGSMYQLWKSPLVSCVPWSSDQTSCLSLQHKSWSSSCKGHDRSIRSPLHVGTSIVFVNEFAFRFRFIQGVPQSWNVVYLIKTIFQAW